MAMYIPLSRGFSLGINPSISTCVVFSSLVVSCQGHGGNGKPESSHRNEIVHRPKCLWV